MSNKIIIKNTAYLYIRMFVNMGISLYTSRIVLQVLGVDDFGIYNLVGGVVVMFSFLNNAMTSATQRFINVEIVSKLIGRINKVFCISLNIHVFISLLVLILSETVGLWFLNHKLNIPPARMHVANIVYQFSVATTLVDIMRVPFNAVILAYERMSFYAFLGIFETFAKLFIVFVLLWFSGYDHLFLYSFFLLIVNLIPNGIYYFYCRKNFRSETKYKFYGDWKMFRQLLSFSSWSLLGQTSVLLVTQGVNMVLNIFTGVAVNAALGIAGQMNGAVYSFVSNAQTAFNPRIVHTHASGNDREHVELVFRASRFSFFLIAVLMTPVLIGTDYMLGVWLGPNVPQYTSWFAKIVLLGSAITSLAGPLWMSAYAVGDIKRYQIILSSLLILVLPASYILLKLGFAPYYVIFTKFAVDFIIYFFRINYFKRTLSVSSKEMGTYVKSFVPILLLLFTQASLSISLKIDGLVSFAFAAVVGEIAVITTIVWLGMNKKEIGLLIRVIKNKTGIHGWKNC